MNEKRMVPIGDGGETIDVATVDSTGEAATPTGRVLDGSSDHGYAQEWTELAHTPDGRRCLKVCIFDHDEVAVELAEDYPWDDDHVVRIQLLDE